MILLLGFRKTILKYINNFGIMHTHMICFRYIK